MNDIEQSAIAHISNVKDRLWERGWRQGNSGPIQGPNCLVGASSYELHEHHVTGDAYEVALHAITAQAERRGARKTAYLGSIANWNDDPDRTFNEVLDLLDAAIVAIKGAS